MRVLFRGPVQDRCCGLTTSGCHAWRLSGYEPVTKLPPTWKGMAELQIAYEQQQRDCAQKS